ncbi:hypothetical protein TRVL_01528 [Trypanosoma vivax]|uniref:Uncharacterized protein n=1 Tax=Trypanosoma vivax (strain Y486) TaxID=1055687 RepID=G0U6R8_TRYVY|nr:hypothetical protein TRVL_01528 [Trypanosoma vivax]CCC51572.1 hypothetical protein TVY486_1006220 [Trypanosoma vivax Y486]
MHTFSYPRKSVSLTPSANRRSVVLANSTCGNISLSIDGLSPLLSVSQSPLSTPKFECASCMKCPQNQIRVYSQIYHLTESRNDFSFRKPCISVVRVNSTMSLGEVLSTKESPRFTRAAALQYHATNSLVRPVDVSPVPEEEKEATM